MGQYWKPVNLDKKEFLHAHKLGDGLKLIEIAYSSHGVMAAVALLLAPLPDGPRGGGDPRSRDPMIGRDQLDSCWGFYGEEHVLDEATTALAHATL